MRACVLDSAHMPTMLDTLVACTHTRNSPQGASAAEHAHELMLAHVTAQDTLQRQASSHPGAMLLYVCEQRARYSAAQPHRRGAGTVLRLLRGSAIFSTLSAALTTSSASPWEISEQSS